MIKLQEYDKNWPIEFEALSAIYKKELTGLYKSIEHIGSTAVKGLCAKPVIDIDIVISPTALTNMIKILSKLGYLYNGEVSIPERYVFKQVDLTVPLTSSGKIWMKHHLYCCIEGSSSLRNHIILRDSLRENAQLADDYAKLKGKLSKECTTMDDYVMGKTQFITNILSKKGMNKDEIQNIIEQNKSVIPK